MGEIKERVMLARALSVKGATITISNYKRKKYIVLSDIYLKTTKWILRIRERQKSLRGVSVCLTEQQGMKTKISASPSSP
jgi:hypothetical protein